MKTKERVNLLFDYSAVHLGGWTISQAAADLGWDPQTMPRVIRALRLELGDSDINLTCTPQGKGEQWSYCLVGSFDHSEQWIQNRLLDAEARLETIHAMLRPAVRATSGRSEMGRKVRLFERAVRHLHEDLSVFNMDGSV